MFSKNVKETGERLIAEEHSEHSPCYLRHKAAYVFAEKFVKGKTVLDVGCGSGYGSYHLVTNGAAKVVGIDVSEEAVEYARERYKYDNLEFKAMSATALKFDEESFDVITSFQVIEHIKEAGVYLSEIKRVLKNNSFALISTPNKKTYSPNSDKIENPFHIKEYYLDELTELLNSYFNDVEIFGVNQSPRIEKLQKSFNYIFRSRIRLLLRKTHLLFLLNLIPEKTAFYMSRCLNKSVNVSDYIINRNNLEGCLDFVVVCRKKGVF
jgi:2-polyprenyl-3-methyl-5-hydroxy-6-metoxy-1,4-benzoquinol methylase